MEQFISEYGTWRVVLMGLVGASFFGNLYYFLFQYRRVGRHRHSRTLGQLGEQGPQPVSVVVVVGDDMDFINEGLALLLEQDYPEYEVVVVNDRPELEETRDRLKELQASHERLYVTTIRKDPVFAHTYKLAITVGVKAARYNNILFLDSDSYPKTDRWLWYMAKGFLGEGEKVVVGYNGIRRRKGFANRYIRCCNVYSSMRMFNRAIRGRAYKAAMSNFGFTQRLFFGHKGFCEHLRLNTGYNDLFIQKIRTRDNTAVILNPKAGTLQRQYGGLGWWFRRRKKETYTQKYYPLSVRFFLAMDPVLRAAFWLSAAALVLLSLHDWHVWGAVAVLAAVRLGVDLAVFHKTARRLGESGLMFTFILYDIFSPVGDLRLNLSRRFRPNKDLWI